jgi:dipeptidyl aminopeptidase/acylaminoacyl peptidase
MKKNLRWAQIVGAVLVLQAVAEAKTIPGLQSAVDQRTFSQFASDYALSPDGCYAVIGVHERTEQGIRPRANAEANCNYNRAGVPDEMAGVRLWLWDTRTGRHHPLSPSGSTSLRPSWSPDSHRFCYLSDQTGQLNPWIYDVPTGTSRKLSAKQAMVARYGLDGACWSSDSRELIVGLRATPLPSTRQTVLQIRSDDAVRDPAADTVRWLNLQKVRLQAFESDSGAALPSHLPRGQSSREVQLSPSGRLLSCLSGGHVSAPYGEARTDLLCWDARSQALIKRVSNLAYPGPNRACSAWRPHHEELDYLEDKRLHRWTPGQPERVEEDVSDWAWSSKGDHLMVVNAARSAVRAAPPSAVPTIPARTTELHLVGTRERVGQPGTGPILQGQTADGRQLILGLRGILAQGSWKFRVLGCAQGDIVGAYEDVASSPSFARLKKDGSWLRTALDPTLTGLRAAPIERTVVTSLDPQGERITLRSSLLRLQSTPRGGPAVVILYPNARESEQAAEFNGGNTVSLPNLGWLINGYSVLLLDSSLGPIGKPIDPAQVLTDQTELQVEAMVKAGAVDPARLILMGHSAGGYAVAAILSRSRRFRAGVSLAGYYDLAGTYATLDAAGGNFFGNYLRSFLHLADSPWDAPERYRVNSPFAQARAITAPMLLMAGQEDPNREEVCRMFSALRSVGRVAELGLYPDEGHVFDWWTRKHELQALQQILRFLKQQTDPAPGQPSRATQL